MPPLRSVFWKGIAIGGVLGGIAGRSLLGVLFGALLGYQIQRRIEFGRRAPGARRRGAVQGGLQDPLAAAYSALGAKPSDSAEELTRRYRALAKKYHPDALRARGLSEREAEKAAERMARINAAWSTIRSARGL